ncbi:phosphate ABC transporter ATP-binding protein [Pleurocapsales cyanobacterium LEGE 10410]|nr:phosphate ABC transporter ATP-binding protein [Pleurocapsales cyanobacterium LEGE 10410]
MNRPIFLPKADCSANSNIVVKVDRVSVFYGDFLAVRDVSLEIPKNNIVAFIGPSGCGKTTILRCFNRMNDLIPNTRIKGKISYYDTELYDMEVDAVAVRRKIGMVFQKPNPYPKSIYNNIAYGARVNGYQGNMDELVERSLRRAFLWDEVKDILNQSGLDLSGGQQQRLCIARAIAVEPEILLMDEPCSALDPISTMKIEELMHELKARYTIIIVTHNMQQAARISNWAAFFNVETNNKGDQTGYLVEYAPTKTIFEHPQEQATLDYVSGRFS